MSTILTDVLLIDDLRVFKDDRLCTIARDSGQALDLLSRQNVWREIWFDHDLGVVDNVGIDTTMRVVDFLCERAYNGSPVEVDTVYVHTSNPVGSVQIMRSLARYGYNCVRVNASDVFTVEDDK